MRDHQKELQQQINEQKFQNKVFFYTVAKKQRALTGSIYPKPITLIFCPQENHLFYVSANQKLPFGEQKNLNKSLIKDVAQVTRSIVTNTDCSVELSIKYPKTDCNNKDNVLEWKFNMANVNVAEQWAKKLNNYKRQKEQEKQGLKLTNTNEISVVKNTNSLGVQVEQPDEPDKQNHSVILATTSQLAPKKMTNFHHENENNNTHDLKKEIKQTAKENRATSVSPIPMNNKMTNSNLTHHPFAISNNNTSKINLPVSAIAKDHTNVYCISNQNRRNEDSIRLSKAYEIKSRLIPQTEQEIKPENEGLLNDDWNYKFIKVPKRETVFEFEKEALKVFHFVFNKNKGKQSLVKQEMLGMLVQIANNFTKESKRLKAEYRNYHYIMESCKEDSIISVPLTCLIEYLGHVCLVKAILPQNAPLLLNKKEIEMEICLLEERTKISNSILLNGECEFRDLTPIYGAQGDFPRIYVDNLYKYLPEFSFGQRNHQSDGGSYYFARPQSLLFVGNTVVSSGNMEDRTKNKQKTQLMDIIQNEIKEIAECLSLEDFYITNIFDLKEFLHSRGVNMKFLFKIYQQTKNKFVKKYLQTCIVAKLIKDEINRGLSTKQFKKIQPEEFVEEQIKLFIEGKITTTKQQWKKLILQYENLYGVTINLSELIGGFLLSCLMTIIYAEYDLNMLNKEKHILKDQNIIKKGFVKQLKPKVKSYYRFSSKVVEAIQICKYSETNQEIFKKLISFMNLDSVQVPESYNVNNGKLYILGYLSDFVSPCSTAQNTLPCAVEMCSLVNSQPPSAPSLKITLNSIEESLKSIKLQKSKGDEKFEVLMRSAIDTINYWMEFEHPKICQFYEKVAIYEEMRGNIEQSLTTLEKALQIAYKTEAKNKKKLSIWHSIIGNQYLKVGRKKEAIQNLQKAKTYMEKSEGQEKEYALVLLRLSSLHLNNGETDNCIKLAKDSLQNAQQQKMSHSNVIKVFEVLCRAYQIKGEKEELRKLGVQCAKDFNSTPQRSAFGEMVKICLSGTIAKLSNDRSKSLLILANKIKDQYGLKDENESLSQLMQKAKESEVMENFMMKSEMVEKYQKLFVSNKLSDEASEYIATLGQIAGCVGLDFIEGLHAQKQFG